MGAAQLKYLRWITELDSSSNPIGDEGVCALARSSPAHYLRFTSCGFGLRGQMAILESTTVCEVLMHQRNKDADADIPAEELGRMLLLSYPHYGNMTDSIQRGMRGERASALSVLIRFNNSDTNRAAAVSERLVQPEFYWTVVHHIRSAWEDRLNSVLFENKQRFHETTVVLSRTRTLDGTTEHCQ